MEKRNLLLRLWGLATSLYHLGIGLFGTPTSLIHRPLAVGNLLLMLFMTTNAKGKKSQRPDLFDCLCGAAVLFSTIYAVANSHWYITRFTYVTPLKALELISGLLLILAILEGVRRTAGNVIPIIAIIAIIYALVGGHFSGLFGHRGFTLPQVVEQLTMTTEGVFSSPVSTNTTIVCMFVIFGSLLSATGMGDFFMELALALTGKYAGGTAKVSVISSGLMGVISGSSVSNVVTTGAFTIPAMKKSGFPDYFAGAVEVVASVGGQIMPPVMGAAAFIMADMTGIPYIQIIKHALLIAVLYYLSTMLQVHFRAKQLGFHGLPKEEIPNIWGVLKSKGIMVLPIVAMVVMLANGFTAMRAGFIASTSVILLALLFFRDRKETVKKIVTALENAPFVLCKITAAVAAAGIIVGVMFQTGIGLRLSSIIVDLAGGRLILGLIFAMLAALLLGMGMPTSSAYIIMASLIAPALIKMGLSVLQAHFFVFYFACMAPLTPPVASAAFAAAGLCGASPQKVGFAAWRLALVAFIIPFMFAYGPELLLVGSAAEILRTAVTAAIGCLGLAITVEGWLVNKATVPERILCGIAALLLISTSLITDLIGIALLAVVLFFHVSRNKNKDQ